MTTPTTSAIDELFEMTAPANPNTVSEVTNASTEQNDDTNDDENTPDTSDPNKIYPNVVASYNFDAFPVGEAPPGTATLPNFAGLLTLKLIQEKGPSVDNIVDKPVIYNSARAKRNPLPVVLVWAEGEEGDQKTATAFIPIEAGFKAWQERPVRGAGPTNTTTSARPIEDLFKDAAGKRAELTAMVARRDRLNERIEKATTQLEKYAGWLKARGKSWDDVSAWEKANDASTQEAEESGPSEPDNAETSATVTQ
jgi:hypothetical protein